MEHTNTMEDTHTQESTQTREDRHTHEMHINESILSKEILEDQKKNRIDHMTYRKKCVSFRTGKNHGAGR